MLAILCKPWGKHGKEDQKSPSSMTRPTPAAPPSALPSKPPQYPLNGCFPLQQIMIGKGRVYVSFQLSDLREIKKHLDSYTDAQTNTSKPFSL
jgi:hypothetical protein